jgi:hypothetical protein
MATVRRHTGAKTFVCALALPRQEEQRFSQPQEAASGSLTGLGSTGKP